MFLTRVAKKIGGSVRGRLSYTNGLGPILSHFQARDDYDWGSYSQLNYYPSLAEFETRFTSQLSKATGWSAARGQVVVSGRPLHPRHQLIYELAMSLDPGSICECGFGGGDHLANLSLLLPSAEIMGADISSDQLALATQRNSELLSRARLFVLDLTRPNSITRLRSAAQFVYCQAVVQHIHGNERHLDFIRNMWSISTRYLFLVESWERHNFVADLHSLFPQHLLYRVGAGPSSGILIDKQNAMRYPIVHSDREIRRHKRVG
jgi:SAM-dependent methyltransferase